MIRETSDGGAPVVASAPDSPQAAAYVALASACARRCSMGRARPSGAAHRGRVSEGERRWAKTAKGRAGALAERAARARSRPRAAHHVRRRFRGESLGRAAARGEPSADKTPPARRPKAGSAIVNVETVGNYAVRIAFNDGHETGIYSWRLLRALAADQASPPGS